MAVQILFRDSGQGTSSSSENPLEGKTVIVADDSALQRRKVKELYESLGLRCVGEAQNGLEALELCELHRPDLVSLDVLMPVMHGVETMAYIRDAQTVRHIVLVSALPNLEEVARLRPENHAPDAIFSKKDNRETFKDVLRNIFNHSRSSHDSESQNRGRMGSTKAS